MTSTNDLEALPKVISKLQALSEDNADFTMTRWIFDELCIHNGFVDHTFASLGRW